MSTQFPCTKCGACCMTVGFVKQDLQAIPDEQLSELKKEFKYFPFECVDGICEKFDQLKGCTIYQDRPDVCNNVTTHAKHFAHIPWEEYVAYSKKSCAIIIDSLGMPEKFKP